MTIKVLCIKDRYQEWQAEFAALPKECRDLHYSAEYFRCFQEKFGHDAHLLIAENEFVKIIYPFISEEKNNLGLRFREIITINEYGGPLFIKKSPALPKEMYIRASHNLMTSIDEFWEENRCVSEKFSIHPFLNEVQHHVLNKFTELKYLREISFVLLDPRATLVPPPVRGKKLEMNRHELSEETLPLALKVFSEKFPFSREIAPEKYFRSYLKHLPSKSMFFTATIDGELAGGVFVLHGYNSAYMQLLAVKPGTHAQEISAALVYDSINWARAMNYSLYHFGEFKNEKSSLQKLKVPGQHSAFAYGYERTREL